MCDNIQLLNVKFLTIFKSAFRNKQKLKINSSFCELSFTRIASHGALLKSLYFHIGRHYKQSPFFSYPNNSRNSTCIGDPDVTSTRNPEQFEIYQNQIVISKVSLNRYNNMMHSQKVVEILKPANCVLPSRPWHPRPPLMTVWQRVSPAKRESQEFLSSILTSRLLNVTHGRTAETFRECMVQRSN